MEPNEIEIHYYLSDGSHSANAFTIARAEIEFISLIRDLAESLDVKLELETQALTEGGIKQVWKAFGKNSGQIACLLSLAALIITLVPKGDRELIELQKEATRLEIEKLKKDLGKEEELPAEAPPPNLDIQSAAEELNNDLKIVRRRSHFYSYIQSEDKISSVSFTKRRDQEPTDDPIRVERAAFSNYIALTGELPTIRDSSAVIEIISPVLKKGKFKWKGYYKGQFIEFWVKDKKFKESVIRKQYEFKNGTSIECVLEMKQKIDEVGSVWVSSYHVMLVKKVIDEDSEETTPQGDKYYTQIKNEEKQLKLF